MKISLFQRVFSSVVLTLCAINAQAGISIDRTRIIVDAAEGSASAELVNNNKELPFLAQSWMENSDHQKITSPLIVIPPIQRIDPAEKETVQINALPAAKQLPQDRESMFYLNVREIPPKPKHANTLQLTLQSRIKVFYRPESLKAHMHTKPWQEKLQFTRLSENQWQVSNPTPYYVVLIGLSKDKTIDNKKMLTNFSGLNLAPFAKAEFRTNQSINDGFNMFYVNDYGGHPMVKFTCQGQQCAAEN
ncbi:molecular chaperone [Rosenbergiella nectarea]|uniref:fimbrial biogenesis chaperone n=1 Tax=Rosenbergiella nectarea TaxID=988801 RepID=UPI001F4DEC9E|nr:fimbria/pilus periplasmic chaperone [Rosenbergiella nectarea]